MSELRTLVVVLGDQLDLEASAFDGFDPAKDAVWMAEVEEESTHVWSSKQRIALFLAAMRHFAQALHAAGRPLHYCDWMKRATGEASPPSCRRPWRSSPRGAW